MLLPEMLIPVVTQAGGVGKQVMNNHFLGNFLWIVWHIRADWIAEGQLSLLSELCDRKSGKHFVDRSEIKSGIHPIRKLIVPMSHAVGLLEQDGLVFRHQDRSRELISFGELIERILKRFDGLYLIHDTLLSLSASLAEVSAGFSSVLTAGACLSARHIQKR